MGQNELQILSKKDYYDQIKDIPASLSTLIENQEILEKTILMSQFSRWNQISRYFLPSRTGKFLHLEYTNIIETKSKAD